MQLFSLISSTTILTVQVIGIIMNDKHIMKIACLVITVLCLLYDFSLYRCKDNRLHNLFPLVQAIQTISLTEFLCQYSEYILIVPFVHNQQSDYKAFIIDMIVSIYLIFRCMLWQHYGAIETALLYIIYVIYLASQVHVFITYKSKDNTRDFLSRTDLKITQDCDNSPQKLNKEDVIDQGISLSMMKELQLKNSHSDAPDTRRHQDHFNAKLIDQFPEGVIFINENSEVTYCNKTALEMFQISDKKNLVDAITNIENLCVQSADETATTQMLQNQEKSASMSTFKSRIFQHQDINYMRKAYRASTHYRPSIKPLMRGSHQMKKSFIIHKMNSSIFHPECQKPIQTKNLFEREISQALIQLSKPEVLHHLKKTDQYELFQTLNGTVPYQQTPINVEIKIFLANLDQGPQVLVLVRDISHRNYISMLRENAKAKSNQLNFVSHEFRTPLNCMLTLLDALQEDLKLNKDALAKVQTVLHNCYFLLNLSNDILDLALIKRGKFKLHKTDFDLERLLTKCVQNFQIRASKQNIQLNLFYEADVPKQVFSDENRLIQVINNLLGNAFKFTLKGQINIKVKMINKYQIEVSVIDTGVGIRDEDQTQLFIAFGKGNSDENKDLNKQGVGLGLLISNMIMKTINNSEKGLYFETAVGLGTRFSFVIDRSEISVAQSTEGNHSNFYLGDPLAEKHMMIPSLRAIPSQNSIRSASDSIEPEASRAKYIQQFNFPRHHSKLRLDIPQILIVDDNQFNIEALQLLLSKRGICDLDFTISGELAIQKVKEQIINCGHPLYKLIFMDVEMPGRDGVETTQEILHIYTQSSTQCNVVACSGYSSQKDRLRCSRVGMVDFIEKPIRKSELDRILNQYYQL